MEIGQIKEEKIKLRTKYKAIRNNFSIKRKNALDDEIMKAFIDSDSFKNATSIYIYISTAIEVDTYKIITEAFKQNKKVAVPKCINKTGDMQFYFITSFDDLEKGEFSIMEPNTKTCEIAVNDSGAVIVIPALSYDENGFRLGFGKGYYDRYLAIFKGVKIGLCYEDCMSKKLPIYEVDIAVDSIVTETRTIQISK